MPWVARSRLYSDCSVIDFIIGTAARALIHRWLWLVLGALLGLIAAVAVVAAQPPSFVATVEVIPNRARFNESFDPMTRAAAAEGEPSHGYALAMMNTAFGERRLALAQ